MNRVETKGNPQRIALLTDSCADLSLEQRENMPVFVVPLRILSEGKEYQDGVDIFSRDIYKILESGSLPQTSLPDFVAVDRVLNEIAAQGYQKVIALHLSSGLSGTFNMVRLQAEYRKDLEVAAFDSLSASLGLGSMVYQLWEDIQAGMSFDQLVHSRIPGLIRNTFPYFSVDTLEYLQKGGRIGKITALAGTMLNIKPVVGFTADGQLVSVAKVRGRKAVQSKLLELAAQRLEGYSGRYNLAVAHGGAPQELEELIRSVKEAFPRAEHLWCGEIDATLSVYIGSGVLGICPQLLDEA